VAPDSMSLERAQQKDFGRRRRLGSNSDMMLGKFRAPIQPSHGHVSMKLKLFRYFTTVLAGRGPMLRTAKTSP
jgi:hypothetical protein